MPRRKVSDPLPGDRRSWGEGSVSRVDSRRGKKKWRARTPRDEAGRRQSTYHLTEADAAAWLVDWLAQAKKAAAPFDASRPLGALFNYWYAHHSAKWTPNQQRKVRSQISVCRPIAHHPANRLTALHVEEFLNGKQAAGCSAIYARHIGRLVNRVLEWAVRRKILDENVAEDIELPSARRKRPQAYTTAEVRKITAGARGERFEAAFLLFTHAGCRIGEVLPMPWTAIDDENNIVNVEDAEQTAAGRVVTGPKYDSTGAVDVAPPIIRRLVELRDAAESPYILGKPDAMIRPHDRKRPGHGRWCDTTVRFDWYKLLARLKLRRLPPHGGRHAFATGHMRTGTDLADIAALMRHKSPAVTAAIYLSGDARRRKAAAERLGALFAVPDPADEQESGTPS
jgi:integrase